MRMYASMNSVRHIRDNIFGLSQVAFAEIAGVSQATVSRWENGELEPNRDDMERIHSAARDRGLALDYETFFVAPPVQRESAA
jgi:DNA-binding transcriptional regulator YiaG